MVSFKPLVLIFALACTLTAYAHGDDFTCGHASEDNTPDLLDIEEDTSSLNPANRLLASYPNMRIKANYDSLASTSSSSYTSYIKNELAPPVIAYLEGALRVKYPVSGKLKLSTSVKKICEFKTPSELHSGVEADYYIFLTSRSEDSTVVASSRYCNLAAGTKRPLIARTSFNRQMLKEAKGDVLLHEKNMYLLIHEIMHTFGVSDSLYKYYVDENGDTLKGHIKKVKIAGKTRSVIDVPFLTQRLRKYYGCSSLPGLILESDGGDGTSGSHLERKFFVYETMASGGIYGRRVSEFSLGLLEASGWYDPDYSYAEPFFFGKGQGCDFINDKCSSSSASFDEFCTGSSRGCAHHGRSGGKCDSDSKTDGCKYIDPKVEWDCDNSDGEDDARLPDLETYGRGSESKCFTGDLNTERSTSKTSFCFKYTCVGSGSSTKLEVQLGRTTVTCTSEGQKTIDGYYGSIDCPDPLTFCGTVGKKYCPRNCMGRGTCVNNKCQCKSGFTGIDCGLNI